MHLEQFLKFLKFLKIFLELIRTYIDYLLKLILTSFSSKLYYNL